MPHLVINLLYMNVDNVDDLSPKGRHLVRNPNTGKLQAFYKEDIPADKLAAAVRERRVYTFWASQESAVDEITPQWPENSMPSYL